MSVGLEQARQAGKRHLQRNRLRHPIADHGGADRKANEQAEPGAQSDVAGARPVDERPHDRHGRGNRQEAGRQRPIERLVTAAAQDHEWRAEPPQVGRHPRRQVAQGREPGDRRKARQAADHLRGENVEREISGAKAKGDAGAEPPPDRRQDTRRRKHGVWHDVDDAVHGVSPRCRCALCARNGRATEKSHTRRPHGPDGCSLAQRRGRGRCRRHRAAPAPLAYRVRRRLRELDDRVREGLHVRRTEVDQVRAGHIVLRRYPDAHRCSRCTARREVRRLDQVPTVHQRHGDPEEALGERRRR